MIGTGAKSRKLDTVVVGAGISGLIAAHALRARGLSVKLFEASDRAGGLLRTTVEDGFLWEHGPNSAPSSAKTLIGLAKEIGLESEIIYSREAAATRLLYQTGRLLPVPTSAKELMKSELFTFGEKLRMFGEPFIMKSRGNKPESVAHFVSRRFGTAPARTLVDAFVSGIYGGDARRVGVRSAFPSLYNMEQEHGSIAKALRKRANSKRKAGEDSAHGELFSFRGGFGQFATTLAESLGDSLELNAEVSTIALAGNEAGSKQRGYRLSIESESGLSEVRSDRIILAVPSRTAGLLLAGIAPMAADILFDIEYAPMLAVHAAFTEEAIGLIPEAFGFLIPRPQRVRTLGWLFNSKIFEDRAPKGMVSLTGFVGGATDPTAVQAPDYAMRHLVLGELALTLRRLAAPVPSYFSFSRAEPGLPQYDLGHSRRLAAVSTLLEQHGGIGLVGNYVDGISLENCAKTAIRVAEEMAQRKDVVSGQRNNS
ncbi:MAG: protoporphyrinogen oxidase [Planctomycetota bacterium]